MPRLYDWQKSETLRSSFEVYDWERSLEQPSARLHDRAEQVGGSARRWAAAAGFLIGNNLAAGAGLARSLTSATLLLGLSIYDNDRRFGFQEAAEELWPHSGQQG